MTIRFVVALMAVGLLLQGCTIQKRSVMPGWHVERAVRVSAITPPTSPEVLVEADKESNEDFVQVMSIPLVPPIPLKALMAYSPVINIASEHQRPRFQERKMVGEFQSRDEVGPHENRSSDPEPSDDDSSVLKRTFMGVLALTLDVASIPLISLGFWFGSWALVMFIALGVGVLWLSWFAWLSAFPKFRSRVREKNNWEVKQKRREEKRQARNNEPSWLQDGGSWGHLGSKMGGLGGILAPGWRVLVPSWLQVEGFWCHLGAKMGDLGAISAPSWGGLGGFWAACWGVVGNMLD